MKSFFRALGFGVLAWLIPFVVAFMVFPLRQANRPLFESIMAVVVTGSAAGLGVAYLKSVSAGLLREGVLLGLLWLVICIAIDAPLMLLGGPMKMSLSAYMADIGVTYLCIPAVTVGLASAKRQGGMAPPQAEAV